jgi:N-acetylglucosaminyl-diphospho-decaprenol L-rhamnosyltransferase
MSEPEISIVVVTHLHRAFIERCLDAIDGARREISCEVFVVDNLSEDGTAEVVAAKYPWARLSVRDRRRGFSDNNNFAIRQSTGRYVLVLNPDTEIRPGALPALVRFMDGRKDAGVAGAKLLFPDGSVQPSCRRFPTFASVVARRTPLRVFMRGSAANARHLMLDQTSTEPREVDWLLGACLFVRREAIHDVGLLDEGYFLYVEDIDWCYRMRQKGWRVFWVPQAEIVHHHLAVSDRRLFSWHSWVHLRSMIRYFRKHLVPRFLQFRPPTPT